VDGRVAGFARQDQVVVGEDLGRDLVEVAGDGGGVEAGVVVRGLGQQVLGRKQGARNLVEVAVEDGDVQHGLPADVGGGDGIAGQKRCRKTVEGTVLGGLMEECVAGVGLGRGRNSAVSRPAGNWSSDPPQAA